MKPLHNYKRFTIIGLGHLLYAAFSWVCDYVIYVYAVFTWGMLIGGGFMTLLSLIQCALTLQIYEKMKIDWVGAGAFYAWDTQEPKKFSGRLFQRIKKKPKVVFIFLCVFSDPFITTAYFRKGQFNGLTAEDWHLFLYSVLFSNGYWICVSGLLGNTISIMWQWLNTHTLFTTYLLTLGGYK
jgi:hypothetical protein